MKKKLLIIILVFFSTSSNSQQPKKEKISSGEIFSLQWIKDFYPEIIIPKYVENYYDADKMIYKLELIIPELENDKYWDSGNSVEFQLDTAALVWHRSHDGLCASQMSVYNIFAEDVVKTEFSEDENCKTTAIFVNENQVFSNKICY